MLLVGRRILYNQIMNNMTIFVLNIIAASPIIIYPVMLLTSIMVFDAPGSENSIGKILTAFLMVGFPILIGICIFLSQKYNSIVWALVACIPFVFLFHTLFIKDFIINKRHEKAAQEVIKNLSQDFIYDSVLANKLAREQGGFIGEAGFFTVDTKNNQIIAINPAASGSFFANPVGKIQGKVLEVGAFDMKTARQAYDPYLNKDYESIFDVYDVVISKSENFEDQFNMEEYILKE